MILNNEKIKVNEEDDMGYEQLTRTLNTEQYHWYSYEVNHKTPSKVQYIKKSTLNN